MSRALVFVACTVWSLRAYADRLVLVNAARDGARGTAALDKLRAAARTGGITIAGGPVASALEAPGTDEDAEVARLVDAAKQALADLDYAAVHTDLRAAEAHYARTGPDVHAAQRLADLNFLAGVAFAGEQKDPRAIEAFRLVRLLDPARTTLDPALYPPRVVALYERAGAAAGDAAPLHASMSPADATPWLDGRAGLPTEVAPGAHYIGASAPNRAGTILRVDARPGAALEPALHLAPLEPAAQAEQARAALMTGVEPALQAARIEELAQADVVAIVRQNDRGEVAAALWEGTTPGTFGTVDDVRAKLASWHVHHTAIADARDGSGASSDRAPAAHGSFWTSGWGIALIGASAAVLITGGILIATHDNNRVFQIGPPSF